MSAIENPATRQMRSYERRLRRIVVAAAILVGLLPSFLVIWIQYYNVATELERDAEVLAVIVERYAVSNPERWILREEHLERIMRGIRPGNVFARVEQGGKTILELGEKPKAPSIQRWRELVVQGQVAGRLVVSRSLDNFVFNLALALIAALLFIFLQLYILERFIFSPMRAANKERLNSEERLNDLVDLSSDWFWEQDRDYRFTVNSVGGFGLAPSANIIGMARWELPILLNEEQWAAHRADLAAERHFTLRYPIDIADSEQRWFEIRGKPIYAENGTFSGYRGIGRDITRVVAADGEIIQHRDHLQEMVDAQLADVVSAKQAAEAANLAKSEFLANISHELRTPMHGVLSFAKLGLGKANLSPEKAREYFSLIVQSGERLLNLLNDLLDLSKLEAGKMSVEFHSGDLAATANQIAAELSTLAAEKNVSVRCQINASDTMIDLDSSRIGQLIRNLLANALRFSPAGSEVVLSIDDASIVAGRRRCDRVMVPALQLSVADSGPGIPEAELESIFEKFIQSSTTKTGAGGTGLGLAICREIALLHAGEISASNRPVGGAQFTFLLPRKQLSLTDFTI